MICLPYHDFGQDDDNEEGEDIQNIESDLDSLPKFTPDYFVIYTSTKSLI